MATNTWTPTGSGGTLCDMTSLTAGQARIGGQWDTGFTVSKKMRFKFKTKLATQGVAGQPIQLFIATAPDGAASDVDGSVGTVDAALTDLDRLGNLIHIGNLHVDDENATPPAMVKSGFFILHERYVSPIVVNATDDDLSATDGDHSLEFEDVGDA